MNHHSLTAAATAVVQLREGINWVLSWQALRMAIENEWGRPPLAAENAAAQPSHLLFNLLTESKEKVYMDDEEDIVDEFMLSLNTEIGDFCIREVLHVVYGFPISVKIVKSSLFTHFVGEPIAPFVYNFVQFMQSV